MIHDTLQAEGKYLPLVSVIVPVYNTQDYVTLCLRSVLEQTYPNFEILCVDDGSTDKSPELIRRLMLEDSRIQLTLEENHGQGYERNHALKRAKGEYVLFLDSDDYLEPTTLDLAVTRAEQDRSDLVVFDWCYYNPNRRRRNYCNQDRFFAQTVLKGTACLELLRITPMFTVNKLYRKSFLLENGICYGEGYLYEDLPFWYGVALHADCVSLIPAPLYRITVNPGSSTRVDRTTDRHSTSMIKAMEQCWILAKDLGKEIPGELQYVNVYYFFQKFLTYYTSRTPKQYRREFFLQFSRLMTDYPFPDQHENRFLTLCLKWKVFSKQRYGLFRILATLRIRGKPRLIKCRNWAKSTLKKGYVRLVQRHPGISYRREQVEQELRKEKYRTWCEQELLEHTILFLGFDNRYTGNSRYLFEKLIAQAPAGKRFYFATDDPLLPREYRVEPESGRFYYLLARAKTIVAESWIPLDYAKREESTWIQLWHGTSIKRLLFDSAEQMVTSRQPANKNRKFRDIQRWDWLLADSPAAADYFHTCFQIPKQKILCDGYPRVKYLLENRHRTEYLAGLRTLYGIPQGRKVVLYLPTWRDYNYHVAEEQFDVSYLLDLQALQELLGQDYTLVYKDHVYLSRPQNVNFKNYSAAETQELLLLADHLITDYSSVLFDALALDLPITLYCTDIAQNEAARGLYPSIWSDLEPLNCPQLPGLADRIRTGWKPAGYEELRKKYACTATDSHQLEDLILA